MISPELCIRCKGKLFCGLENCPILEKQSRQKTIESAINGNDFEGITPPGFFVSWKNYPKVAVAPLSSLPSEANEMSDLPEQWYGLPQEKIISFRESLLRSYKIMPVNSAKNPDYELQDFQEITMASGSIAVELLLANKPRHEMSFDSFVAPMGPSAKLDALKISGNPKVPKKIENFYSDTDAKSATALVELFKGGFPVSVLSKVLSSGSLGVKKNRKIVPTRWAITGTQDVIGKYLIDRVKEFSIIDSIQVFEDIYFDNKFFILLLPKPWSFEQLEAWVPGSVWNSDKSFSSITISHDHEFFGGMKGYADNVTGAYYAVRLSVLEYLVGKKKQAMVVVFREVGEGYKLPLGSWVCGETAKAAMRKEPKIFSKLELALSYIGKKIAVPIQRWEQESAVLDYYNKQKTLFDF